MSGAPHITRAQLEELMTPMLKLAGMNKDGRTDTSITRFTVPLTRHTSVKVEFSGPVGVDEYDSLLAHIAYYKTLAPQEGEEKLGVGTSNDFVNDLRAIVSEIWRERTNTEGRAAE